MLHACGAAMALALAAATPADPPIADRPEPKVAPTVVRLEEEDIEPTIAVLESEGVSVRAGGLVQVHAVPWAGKDALLGNNDVASRPGFRLRRARLGMEGKFQERLGMLLAVNLLEADEEVGTVSDAKLWYDFGPWMSLSAGTGKVPFSRSALTSSKRLAGVERPLPVSQLTPSRRLGLTAEGAIWGGRFGYLASVMNGTEGFGSGNRFGGALYGARVELSPLGPARRGGQLLAVSLGAGALMDQGPSARGEAYSLDVLATYRGASLQLEYLCDRRAPVAAPVVSPGIADAVRRCGGYGEATYSLQLAGLPLELMARLETFDDNLALLDSGDALLFDAGVNADLLGQRARLQLQYLGRRERAGGELDNDVVVLSLQGAF